MRAGNENGGLTDQVIDLREAGYCSTTALSRHLGFDGTISGTWIINELGIKPAMVLRGGNSMYWAPEQIRAVRRALIRRLLDAEFSAKEPR